MTRKCYIWALAACLIACATANGYGSRSGPQGYSGPGAEGGADAAAAAASEAGGAGGPSAGEYGVAGGEGAEAVAQAAPSSYGSDQNIPYKPVNNKGNTLTSSITYPQNKGEILIHRPAPIIVKRPPTKVLVNHPPLVVKPAPVVLHKPPAIVLRKVYIKHHPRRVKVEPVFVNVVKPPAEKYFVNENKQGYGQPPADKYYNENKPGYGQAHGHAHAVPQQGPALPAYASGADSAAASAGYQLLQGGNHGLSALANIAGNEPQYGHGQQYGVGPSVGAGGYGAPSY